MRLSEAAPLMWNHAQTEAHVRSVSSEEQQTSERKTKGQSLRSTRHEYFHCFRSRETCNRSDQEGRSEYNDHQPKGSARKRVEDHNWYEEGDDDEPGNYASGDLL